MLRRAGYLMVTAALLVAGTLPVAWAQTRIQQARVRKIKACVAVIPSYGEPTGDLTPATPDPEAANTVRSPARNQHLFYVLNNRQDLKPDGWSFYNPAAPPFVTNQINRRWGLPVGEALTPDMAPYWEVLINEQNYDYLAQMDVIYLPISRRQAGGETPVATHFTEGQRRVLARLASSGVTIWVDWAIHGPTGSGALGGSNVSTRNPFFTNLDFGTSGGATAQAPTLGHPLLSTPYLVAGSDATNLGFVYTSGAPSQGRAVNMRPVGVQPTSNLSAVVPLQGVTPDVGAYVAAGRYGAGYIVATAGNVGAAITNPIGNNLKAGDANLFTAEREDLKFAYNVCAWSSEVIASQNNARHTGQNSVQVNGLIEKGTYPYLVSDGSAQNWAAYPPPGVLPAQLPINLSAPLIVDNVVLSATASVTAGGGVINEINAFEVKGTNDFDSDGVADEAPLDISLGQQLDRIATIQAPGNAPVFGMVVGEVPDSLSSPLSSQGSVPYAFGAGPGGLFSVPVPRQRFSGGALAPLNPPSVAASLGVNYLGAPGFTLVPGQTNNTLAQVYAGGASANPQFGAGGKVVAWNVDYNGQFGTPAWYYPPNQEANRMGPVVGPVTVAQVVDEGTGAIDTMVITTAISSGGPGGAGPNGADTSGKVEGFIVATQGDPLTFPKAAQPNANNPNAGRRFVSERWINLVPGTGQVPQPPELRWDPSKHYEVRVLDRATNYVILRFIPGVAGFNILPDGTGGQVELPQPPVALAVEGKPNVWDLSKVVLVADYSVLPQSVDQGGATIRPRFSPHTPYIRGSQQVVPPTGVAGGVAVGTDNLVYYGTGMGYMCAAEWSKGQARFRWKIRGYGADYNAGGGMSTVVDPTNAAYLSDYAFVAAPAAGEYVVFASKNGTVYVMERNATIRFKLPGLSSLTVDQARNVMLEADHGIGFNPASSFIRSNLQPWGRVPNQFVVDPDTATVTFLNMENFSLDLNPNNVLSPGQLAALGIDTGGRPATTIQWKLGPSGMPQTAYIPLPIVAVYRNPSGEQFYAPPVIAGDRIILMGASGLMHELPLDPKAVNPSFPQEGPAIGGLDGHNLGNVTLYGNGGLYRVRNICAGLGLTRVMAPAAVGNDLVAVSTPRGLTVYDSPKVVIADSNRVLEVTGDSRAVASTDTVVKHRFDISEFAIPTDPGFVNAAAGGRHILTERKMLNRPAVVRKLDRGSSLTGIFTSTSLTDGPVDSQTAVKQHSRIAEDSYLAADTGNNRVVEFNSAGKVVYELADFQDPFGILPAGEPLKLSQPMDVQRWIELEQMGSEVIYVIHTLVADTGNTRVLEIVDKVRYRDGNFQPDSYVVNPNQRGVDGQPIRWYHALVWSSQTNAQGLKLRYRTAERVYWPNPVTGGLIQVTPSSGGAIPAATSTPPYLPPDRYLSFTMATVSGAQVNYPNPTGPHGTYPQFVQYDPATMSPNVVERKPQLRSGGDSVVFLRGRYALPESGSGPPVAAPLREPHPNPVGQDKYRFSQGVIDPTLPAVWEVRETAGGNTQTVHRFRNIQSVQFTFRRDVGMLPPSATGGGQPQAFGSLLVADAEGVWEAHLGVGNQPSLLMAFTNEDYAYVTGAGDGNPVGALSNTGTPGGRRLSATSARRLPNGMIVVVNGVTRNAEPPPSAAGGADSHQYAGPDVFLLHSRDFITTARRGAPYVRADIASHGWKPDAWVQNVYSAAVPPALRGFPSIRWRAAEPWDPLAQPTLRTPTVAGANPNELYGSYIPQQPTYADLVLP